MTKIAGLTPGRMVHFVLPNDEHRAAIVSRVWNDETGVINCHVFVDTSNDPVAFHYGQAVVLVSSVNYSEECLQGTWHWMERA